MRNLIYSSNYVSHIHPCIQSYILANHEIPPLILFCLDLLIFLTIPIITHKTMIITINMITTAIGIDITATIETTAVENKIY